MLINLREYHRPNSLAEASRWLTQNPEKSRILAGGTRLLASADSSIEEVVDLQSLPLNGTTFEGREYALGSLVTFQQLLDSKMSLEMAGGLLAQAARSRSASKMIRNRSTIGGELASGEAFSAFAACLLALDGSVVLSGSKEETVQASLFFSQRSAFLNCGSIITAVRIPRFVEACGWDLQRLSVIPSAKPILCVATMVRRVQDSASQVRIAIAGGCTVPMRLRILEQKLTGTALTEEHLKELERWIAPLLAPPADIHASAEYRREVAPVLVRRSILRSWEMAGRNSLNT
jgi:aerobic carbon-monoxide dehydrogenase medium subunit